MRMPGRRQLIMNVAASLLSLSSIIGKSLWSFQHVRASNSAATAAKALPGSCISAASAAALLSLSENSIALPSVSLPEPDSELL